ncbi:MAG TPA: biotin-dependent carboxyltransferase family protein [Azospirillum sp.]|nr:biotin-dependent carboxyltransferase family protein [Azospirillum sp.]
MSAALVVVQPGLHTTVQDGGRFGAQAFGVPVSGALDAEQLRLANALVGNGAGEAALEILHIGPVLEVAAPTVRIALAAFDGALVLETAEGRTVPAWRSLTLKEGDRVRVVASRQAASAYLAVEGGFDLAPVLGSRATYTRGGFGGFEGRALAAGDRLPLRRERASERGDLRLPEPPAVGGEPLRIVLGPQDDRFPPEAITLFCGSDYTVGPAADRMGLRLIGAALTHLSGHDIVSDGIATGAIQVPGDGRPVLLLADRQTTGGYPKLGAVCTADLPRAGRLRPGDRVRFAAIDVEEAQRARRRQEEYLKRLVAGLVPADEQVIDLDALYSANLVSGAVNGFEWDDADAAVG